MADITVNYSYKIPNEQFIDNFSEGLMGQFVYTGPEVLVITLPPDGSGYTQKLDGPVYQGETTIEINVKTNPELLPHAQLLWGRAYGVEAQFRELILEDGTVYKEQTNKTIHDYYWNPRFNMQTQTWPTQLELIVRDALSPKMRTYVAKGEMFVEILEQFELEAAEQTKLTAYKTALAAYKQRSAFPWKYPGINPFDLEAPKIPMALIQKINEAKESGFITEPT
jgi:hypothetical protein